PLSILVLIGILLLPASHFRGLSEAEGNVAGLGPHKRTEASELSRLMARHVALQHQLAQQAPADHYIVVDTAHNRLYVNHRRELLLTALASTGSGTILNDPDHPGTKWIFDTPRGEFAIQSKLTNPVWVKPDWAFLEEGLDVPNDPDQRYESGVLGDYALGFGKGYFIHGTLYDRFLGKNVTHGCIRLSDDDLQRVYQLAKIGTPVMIF
ncbi:MAG TPA: L,D-transpeptidase, partial [Nitrospiraceae bacterium]|nr:L,D-transpeptidase [Nitrospiraceae bacterium]